MYVNIYTHFNIHVIRLQRYVAVFILAGNQTWEPEVVMFWSHLIGCRSRRYPAERSENALMFTCSGRTTFQRYSKHTPGNIPK